MPLHPVFSGLWTQPRTRERGTVVVNATSRLFEVEEPTRSRPSQAVPKPQVQASEDDLCQTAGVALWGPWLDRVDVVGVADELSLRKVGPGGYSGGVCYRSLVETLLAGGDFLADVARLRDRATQRLRGGRVLPSHDTLWRFCNQADIGTAGRAGAVNRTVLARAWALGGAPDSEVLTLDPDATRVATYGQAKHGSRFSYNYAGTCLHPLVGVVGETGEVVAVRNRGGNANAGRALGSFAKECIEAVPAGHREDYQLWVRSDSAGYQAGLVEVCEDADVWFSVTAKQFDNVRGAIEALAADDDTGWADAAGGEAGCGSQVAETTVEALGRTLRLVVRRQPAEADGDAQLSFDDVDGFRFQAIITNIGADQRSAVEVEAHHRLRGGLPEDAIRQLKGHFGFNHAPLQDFFGNWLWQHAAALAYNVSVWLRRYVLPESFTRVRGKRLRLAFLNVAARIGTHARRVQLKFAAGYRWAADFAAAIKRLHALPAFG